MKARLRTVGAEHQHVAVAHLLFGDDPHTIHERPIGAADVVEQMPAAHRAQLGVPTGDVDVLVGIEPQVVHGVAAYGDHRLLEPLTRPGPCAVGDAELDRHQALSQLTR